MKLDDDITSIINIPKTYFVRNTLNILNKLCAENFFQIMLNNKYEKEQSYWFVFLANMWLKFFEEGIYIPGNISTVFKYFYFKLRVLLKRNFSVIFIVHDRRFYRGDALVKFLRDRVWHRHNHNINYLWIWAAHSQKFKSKQLALKLKALSPNFPPSFYSFYRLIKKIF